MVSGGHMLKKVLRFIRGLLVMIYRTFNTSKTTFTDFQKELKQLSLASLCRPLYRFLSGPELWNSHSYAIFADFYNVTIKGA